MSVTARQTSRRLEVILATYPWFGFMPGLARRLHGRSASARADETSRVEPDPWGSSTLKMVVRPHRRKLNRRLSRAICPETRCDVRSIAFYLSAVPPNTRKLRGGGGRIQRVDDCLEGAINGERALSTPRSRRSRVLRPTQCQRPEWPRRRWQLGTRTDGFCYYHYWFEGRRLLERPFNEVLRSNQPDFPFLLVLGQRDMRRGGWGTEATITSFCNRATRPRTISGTFTGSWRHSPIPGISGCGVGRCFSVYRVSSLPDPRRTTDLWRQESVRLGAGDPYLCIVQISMLITSTPAPWVSTPPSRLHPTGRKVGDRREGIGEVGVPYEKHSIEGPRTERTTCTTTSYTSNRSSDLPNLGIRPTPACVRGSTTPLGGRGAVQRCCSARHPPLQVVGTRDLRASETAGSRRGFALCQRLERVGQRR